MAAEQLYQLDPSDCDHGITLVSGYGGMGRCAECGALLEWVIPVERCEHGKIDGHIVEPSYRRGGLATRDGDMQGPGRGLWDHDEVPDMNTNLPDKAKVSAFLAHYKTKDRMLVLADNPILDVLRAYVDGQMVQRKRGHDASGDGGSGQHMDTEGFEIRGEPMSDKQLYQLCPAEAWPTHQDTWCDVCDGEGYVPLSSDEVGELIADRVHEVKEGAYRQGWVDAMAHVRNNLDYELANSAGQDEMDDGCSHGRQSGWRGIESARAVVDAALSRVDATVPVTRMDGETGVGDMIGATDAMGVVQTYDDADVAQAESGSNE